MKVLIGLLGVCLLGGCTAYVQDTRPSYRGEPAVAVVQPSVTVSSGWGYYSHPYYGYGYHPYEHRNRYYRHY